MSDALKRVAGQKLKNILESLTKRRVVAVMVGALTTCLVQSSSATTVMTVGFVNAGLLTLRQALCVVLGANVGTTFTAWLVSALSIFKITSYALPAIGIGFLIDIIGKSQKTKNIGRIVLGFGLLFLGLHFMKNGFEPLGGVEKVQDALIWLGRNPILAVIAGTIITMLLQSSSASIAMIQMLALQGVFGLEWHVVLQVTIPYILGDNIGTTITAQLAAMRSSRNAKRAAMGHTIINCIGVLYILPFVWLGWFSRFIEWVIPGEVTQGNIMVYIAVAHSSFNVFNTIVFIPIIGWLEAIIMKIMPVRDYELDQKPIVLERHLLDTPVIALEQAKREIDNMAKKAQKALNSAVKGLLGNDRAELDSTMQTEDIIDQFQFEITSYLAALSRKQLSERSSIALPVLLHSVNDLERIGDHAVNIVELAERKISQKIIFTEPAMAEAERLIEQANQMFDLVLRAMETNDVKAAYAALKNENAINQMQVEFRRSHVQRMTDGVCTPEAGLIFIDLVDNIEKIGDHLTNIAQAVVGGLEWYGVDGSALTGEYPTIDE